MILSDLITEYTAMENTILQYAIDSKTKDFTRGYHIDPVLS